MNTPYATSASSYYPSYGTYAYPSLAAYPAYPATAVPAYSPAASYSYPSFAYPAPTPVAAASGPYPSFAPASGSPDFHAVLDSFVRSAGLSPTGAHDQEAAASSIQAKGDTPVFSFKKLYSFPFYLTSDNAASDGGFNLQIPYLKRHIRRMSSGSDYDRQKHVQALHHQQQLLRAMAQTEFLNNYIQNYLRERAEREAADNSAAAVQDYRRKVAAERFVERQREYEARREAAQQQSNAARPYESVSDMQQPGDSGEEVGETQYQPKFAAYNYQPATIAARSDANEQQQPGAAIDENATVAGKRIHVHSRPFMSISMSISMPISMNRDLV